jgi:hypothetical protein
MSSVQHLHIEMLAHINACYLFCVAHSRALFILENLVSIVSFLPFLKKILFYGSSFTMTASTANIAKKKVTTLPTTLDDASIADFVLEQVFDKVSHEQIQVDGFAPCGM